MEKDVLLVIICAFKHKTNSNIKIPSGLAVFVSQANDDGYFRSATNRDFLEYISLFQRGSKLYVTMA